MPVHTNITSAAAGTRYFVSEPTIAEITPDGLILAKATGTVTISVIHGGKQHDIQLTVKVPILGAAAVPAKGGVAVQDADGNQLIVADGALPAGTTVSLQTRSLNNLGMPLPAANILDALAAVDIQGGPRRCR